MVKDKTDTIASGIGWNNCGYAEHIEVAEMNIERLQKL